MLAGKTPSHAYGDVYGCAPNSASVGPTRLMQKPEVHEYINARRGEILEKLEIDAEFIRRRAVEILERCMQKVPVLDDEGNETGEWTFDAKGALGALKLLAEDCPDWGQGRIHQQVLPVISMAAVVNGALIQLIMASRILYGMSRKGWMPAALSRVNPVTRTPLQATALVVMVTLALALLVPLVTLASLTSFVVLLVFAFVNLALVRVKRREPKPVGVRTYPGWVPVVGFATSAGLIASQLLVGV